MPDLDPFRNSGEAEREWQFFGRNGGGRDGKKFSAEWSLSLCRRSDAAQRPSQQEEHRQQEEGAQQGSAFHAVFLEWWGRSGVRRAPGRSVGVCVMDLALFERFDDGVDVVLEHP
jgi:hypothetical protein